MQAYAALGADVTEIAKSSTNAKYFCMIFSDDILCENVNIVFSSDWESRNF